MIPSSVHEFLLLVMDKKYVNCGYVKQMIKEANKESLEKEDVLSDNLYYYNAVNDAVSIVEQEDGMKYTLRSEKELQEVIQACAGIPQKVIDNAKYNIGFVEECFEDGACGNFYILTDDDGIQYTLGHDCRRMTESLQKTLFQNSSTVLNNSKTNND